MLTPRIDFFFTNQWLNAFELAAASSSVTSGHRSRRIEQHNEPLICTTAIDAAPPAG